MIISHRGHLDGLQENKLEAFDAALKAGADAVECDLRLTKDKKVVVCHDNKLNISGKHFKVSKTNLSTLTPPLSLRERERTKEQVLLTGVDEVRIPQNDEQEKIKTNLLTIDELFDYISQKRVPFFLEVKNRSPILIEEIAKRIKDRKLWSDVHIMGFSLFIKNAIRAQAKYDKLRVLPIINFPLYSYIRKPKKSYGIFVGWMDGWYGSSLLFRKLIPTNRLIKLKDFYEKKGFRVMAGVINKKKGFEYFKKAGIEDIVTDNIREAVSYFNSGHPELARPERGRRVSGSSPRRNEMLK